MTELRDAERTDNLETISTAKDGSEAVKQALEVLKQFYDNAFIQYVPKNSDREGKTVADKAPEIFDEKYHGRQDSAGGIIGLLEVIVSDFERTIENTQNDDDNAQT